MQRVEFRPRFFRFRLRKIVQSDRLFLFRTHFRLPFFRRALGRRGLAI